MALVPGSRVALFLPDLSGGGAERVTLELARGLLARSFAVDLVLLDEHGPLRGAVPRGTRVVALGARRMRRALPLLRRYLRTSPPDVLLAAIVHANVVAVAACRTVRPRVRVIVAQHNTLSLTAQHATGRFDRHAPRIARVVYPRADRIIAVSRGVAEDLARTAHIGRDRIDVAANPVLSPQLMQAAERPAGHRWLLEAAGPVLVGIGRLTDQKDFPTLIRALALLDPDVRLIILGEGPCRRSLERLAGELGVADRIDLPGFVDNPHSYLREAAAFVLSSRWEGLPTVLIEALAFGCAIVATDCPSGPREILAGGRWGALVPVGDAPRMASAITAALRTPARRPVAAWAPYLQDTATERYLHILGEVAGR